MSHTVRSRIELRNPAALRAAVEAMGGTWLGLGTHHLYAGNEHGQGFKLPGWQFPLVSKETGELAYDDYNGSWGRPQDIDILKAKYAHEAARQAASEQGWYTEAQADGTLMIFHPDGGTITVSPSGTIDANGFTGTSCAQATEPIAKAIGATTEESVKAEYNQRQLKQNTQG